MSDVKLFELDNGYILTIDGKPWCATSNDDDGFKLAVAVQKYECVRNLIGVGQIKELDARRAR